MRSSGARGPQPRTALGPLISFDKTFAGSDPHYKPAAVKLYLEIIIISFLLIQSWGLLIKYNGVQTTIVEFGKSNNHCSRSKKKSATIPAGIKTIDMTVFENWTQALNTPPCRFSAPTCGTHARPRRPSCARKAQHGAHNPLLSRCK